MDAHGRIDRIPPRCDRTVYHCCLRVQPCEHAENRSDCKHVVQNAFARSGIRGGWHIDDYSGLHRIKNAVGEFLQRLLRHLAGHGQIDGIQTGDGKLLLPEFMPVAAPPGNSISTKKSNGRLVVRS